MNQEYKRVGRILGEAMTRRRDRPALAVLDFMEEQLEISKVIGVAPDWASILKESARIWKEG